MSKKKAITKKQTVKKKDTPKYTKSGKSKGPGSVPAAATPVPDSAGRIYGIKEPTPLKKGERSDWHRNHELILYHVYYYIKEHRRFPSAQKLQDMTGIHRKTIERHLKDYDQTRRKDKFKIALEGLVAKLIDAAMTSGDKASIELAFKYVDNWSERLSLEHSGRIDFRTAREKIDESKDNFERTRNFVNYLVLQNNRLQHLGSN